MTDAPAGTPSYFPRLTQSLRATLPCRRRGAGGGRKAWVLLACGARVSVIAPDVGEEMNALTSSLAVLEARVFRPGDVTGFRLVMTATGDPEIDGAVAAEAEAAGVWVNSADDPAHCSFYCRRSTGTVWSP